LPRQKGASFCPANEQDRSIHQIRGSNMPELLAPLAVSAMIFFCTFAAAVFGMVLRKSLPDDHLSEDSKDVIRLVMGLIATTAALVLGLLIASANNSYETQSGELQQVAAAIVELDAILAQYGSETNDPRHRLRVAVSATADRIWPKDGVRVEKPTPAANHAEGAAFYESIAKLSPTTEAQRFIQKRALEIGGTIRHTRARQQFDLLAVPRRSCLLDFDAVRGIWPFRPHQRDSDRCSRDRSSFGLECYFSDIGIESPLPRLDAHLWRTAAQRASPGRAMNASRKPRPPARGHRSFCNAVGMKTVDLSIRIPE
jgi:hypothetical protein